MKRVFAFDLGKTSIGYCVREDNCIKDVNSLIIDKEHSEITSIRDRKQVYKTVKAHKSREKFLDKLWQDCGLTILDKDEPNLKKEFGGKSDNEIYTSCLLRIALLQNKKLKEWQIYKALRNAIQRRGYDANLPWKAVQTDDDKYNIELIKRYSQEDGKEIISSKQYQYPCYYDALRLGLWSEATPEEIKSYIPAGSDIKKVRTTNYVAPRELVTKELKQLWTNAQLQLPVLKKYSIEEFLYGEYKEAYGSFKNSEYRKYMGTENDWQGVLGQKIPRFDNRIIAKCKLLPKRNVCKANTLENVTFVLLMKLKNLRFTDKSLEKRILNPTEIKEIYENWLIKVKKRENKLDTTITKKDIEDVIKLKILDKIEPMKVNLSGRSSFCRRACLIMNKFILSGELYPLNMDISEFVDTPNAENGITKQEIKEMLSKIGDGNKLFIPDNRDENAQDACSVREKTDIMIGNITNPIVRNRLQIFRDLLLNLAEEHGKPDEVIFEFVRDGADNSLFGKIKAQSIELGMKKLEKENIEIKKELEDNNCYNATNFEKLKLLRKQAGKCVYSGKNIGINNLDECEIDHIYPRTLGGNDVLYNKVLCYRIENQNKKGRTPYEWLHSNDEAWGKYVNRLNEIKSQLGKNKYELLTSKPEDCEKLIHSYNALAETSHIARVAQEITAFTFSWKLQAKDEKRHIYVNNGASTAAIRKRYKLNSLLGNDIKKNRSNDKHHALDAICISYSRDFKYNHELKADVIEGFTRELVKNAITEIIPYPYTNKKPFKGNIRPLETIYGYRQYGDKSYITNRVDITSIEQKEKKISSIIDEVIKKDLQEKLSSQMPANDWKQMLQNYIHPTKKTRVKKVMLIISEGQLEKDMNGNDRIGEFADFGTKGVKHQFKHSKGHKGQILYYDVKNKIKVMPIYSNQKAEDVKQKLVKLNCKLYNKGQIFYSGSLISIDKPFNATVYYNVTDETGKDKTVSNKELVPSGVFKIRTIKTDGVIKLENNSGVEILTSASTLAGIGMKKC